MNFKAVLFDLDGTLLDTLQDLADATNQALARLGFPPHETPAYKHFVGEGRDVLALRALPQANRNPDMVRQLLAFIDDEYTRCWPAHTTPYPGIPELLDALAARGAIMAVLSNKAQEFTSVMVAGLLSRWRFAAVIGASADFPRKPDPAAAIEITRRLVIPPAEFLYLGDSDIDMKTATAAGMYPVGAVWGFRTAAELRGAGAKALVTHPPDLLKLL